MAKKTIDQKVKEVIDLLTKYQYKEDMYYDPTDYGARKLCTSSLEAKDVFLKAFANHPAYDGDGRIVLSEKMYRKIDKDEVERFGRFIYSMMPEGKSFDYKFKVGDRVRILDVTEVENHAGGINGFMIDAAGHEAVITSLDGYDRKPCYRLAGYKWLWDERALESLETSQNKTDKDEWDGTFTMEQRLVFYKLYNFPTYLDEEYVKKVNDAFPWVKAHDNQKTSRVIMKICRKYGFDKHPDFNGKYTRFADAINPLAITRWTIISVNLIDILTMSFGNSWASCHTIDKTNLRDMPNNYQGMYSGGTLSYALDGVTFIMYTVDGAYKGDEWGLQPKINRQMFHYGEGKLIQGRMYPQDNDTGSADLYRQFRTIAQRVISECFGLDNYWLNKKGVSECDRVTVSKGVHYRDYLYYDNCNVSYNTHEEEGKNFIPITIGARGICPKCGEKHDNQGCILCESCYNDIYCDHCGESITGSNYIEIEDHYYCCAECAEEYGWHLCNDGEWHNEDQRDVLYDDFLEEWCYDRYDYFENAVHTPDGHHFINEENAREYGYLQTRDGDWYMEDELEFCDECGQYVLESEFDFEHDCCNRCARTRREEEESA